MLTERFYKVTNIAFALVKDGMLSHTSASNEKYRDVYICMDTPYFLIAKVNTLSRKKESRRGKYDLKIYTMKMEDVISKLSVLHATKNLRFFHTDTTLLRYQKMRRYCNQFSISDLFIAILLVDDEEKLVEVNHYILSTLRDITDILDCGYGIEKDMDSRLMSSLEVKNE